MTQMDLLVTNVAELLATAVHEVLRLMGHAVAEYRDESARIRQENRKLQRALQEIHKRLQISDAVQHVSSSVSTEEPRYEHVPARCSDREPVEPDDDDDDSYELSFEEDKPSALHPSPETQEPGHDVSSPWDLPHKRRRSFSSSRSRSASPNVVAAPGIINNIKTEAEFPQQTENGITDTHLLLSFQPVHTGYPAPPGSNVTARRENSHTCHVCGKSFATASSLGAHFVCHSGERPFACESCNFRFSRSADLKKHQRIHTGEKPYDCALCGRRFNRTENLRRHLSKVHHGAPL